MDVVTSATRLYSETFGRFHIAGPNERLEPKTVLGLGLMLHEPGTNELKYGALSVPRDASKSSGARGARPTGLMWIGIGARWVARRSSHPAARALART
jgi:hypothetical protein